MPMPLSLPPPEIRPSLVRWSESAKAGVTHNARNIPHTAKRNFIEVS
jgi:hypothetical protein